MIILKIIDHVSCQPSMCGSERPNRRRDPPEFLCLFLFFRKASLAWGWLRENDWAEVCLRVSRRCAHDGWQVDQTRLPRALRCWWLRTSQMLCSKVRDNIPTGVQDSKLPPMFFELCKYPRLIENDNWNNEIFFLRGISALLKCSGFTSYCSFPKALRYWWLSKISFILRS